MMAWLRMRPQPPDGGWLEPVCIDSSIGNMLRMGRWAQFDRVVATMVGADGAGPGTY
jgi:hypothetical protein